MKSNRLEELTQNYEALINRKNEICSNKIGRASCRERVSTPV